MVGIEPNQQIKSLSPEISVGKDLPKSDLRDLRALRVKRSLRVN